MVMMVAPLAVACLIFSVTARFGFDILMSLATYVVTVVAGLGIFMAVVYPLTLTLVAGRSPAAFFREAWIVIVTAFSTSSSNATLPTTLRVAEEKLGVPNEVAGFVVPLGATMNMDGTALFGGVTVLFIAQVFGIDLALTEQIIVVLMSVVVSVGAAGVPGGSIPLLMIVLSMVGRADGGYRHRPGHRSDTRYVPHDDERDRRPRIVDHRRPVLRRRGRHIDRVTADRSVALSRNEALDDTGTDPR